MNRDKCSIFFRGTYQVGKTKFIGRYIEGKNYYSSSIKLDFRLKKVQYNNHTISQILFQMQGQEYMIQHPPAHNYRRSQGILLLFDVTNRRSFLALKIEIENKESALAELEEIISMAEELKYRLSTFKVPEVSLKEEPLAESAERLLELRSKAINRKED